MLKKKESRKVQYLQRAQWQEARVRGGKSEIFVTDSADAGTKYSEENI